MLKVNCEFTRNGNFAVWESGSFSSESQKGWSVLAASADGKKLPTLFARNPAQSRNHFLFKIDIGFLAVVANIKPWTSNDLVTVKIVVAYFSSLASKPTPGKTKDMFVDYATQTIWSESFIAAKSQVETKARELSVEITDKDQETLNRIYEMVQASVVKALTLPEKQQLFWGVLREPDRKPKPGLKNGVPIAEYSTPVASSAMEEIVVAVNDAVADLTAWPEASTATDTADTDTVTKS